MYGSYKNLTRLFGETSMGILNGYDGVIEKKSIETQLQECLTKIEQYKQTTKRAIEILNTETDVEVVRIKLNTILKMAGV
jgi:hypothetical protein